MISLVLRAIAVFIACVVVGLVLEKFGIPAKGTLRETWLTVSGLVRKFDYIVAWSVPHAMLGAVAVGPLLLLVLIDRYRRRRRR